MPEPRSSESPKPPSWSEWKAQNASKLWCWRAPLAVEWALERFVHRLRGLALFELLELAGKLTVLVAVIFWFLEADNRAKERHYRAWELINAARGSTGDGGRRDALQDLNKDGVSLAAAPLQHAYLFEVDLKGADLEGANLQEAHLRGADLEGANLQEAHLRGADLSPRMFGPVEYLEHEGRWLLNFFIPVIVDPFNYVHTSLRGAFLQDACLEDADLQGADLRRARLGGANLQGADLRDAKLEGAYLGDGRWGLRTNLRGTKGLTQEQLNAANGNDQTLLPEGLTRPTHWLKAERIQARPAAQPDVANCRRATGETPGSEK